LPAVFERAGEGDGAREVARSTGDLRPVDPEAEVVNPVVPDQFDAVPLELADGAVSGWWPFRPPVGRFSMPRKAGATE